jgi:hypothetical protein
MKELKVLRSNYLTFSFLKAVVIYQNWFFDILRTVITYSKNRLDNRLAFLVQFLTAAENWTKPKTLYTHLDSKLNPKLQWIYNINAQSCVLNSNELYIGSQNRAWKCNEP